MMFLKSLFNNLEVDDKRSGNRVIIVLCANCHSIVHWNEKHAGVSPLSDKESKG